MLIRKNHGRKVHIAACLSLTAAAAAALALLPCAPASAQSRDREKETQEQQRRQPAVQKTTTTYTSRPAPQQQQQQSQQQRPSAWFNPPTMGSTSPTMASSSPTMASSSPTFGSRQPYFVPSPYPDTALPPMRAPQLPAPSTTWPGERQQQPHVIYKSQQRYGSSNSQREREAQRQRGSTQYSSPYSPYGSGGSVTVLPGGTTVITPGAFPDYGPVVPGGSLQVINKGPRGSVTLFDGFSTIYVPGKTCYSPYWRHYGAPRYIRANCVITAPWAYLSGYEVSTTSTLIIPTVRTAGTIVDSGVIDSGGGSSSVAAPQNTGAASQALRNALRDLARFWEDGDAQALRRRVAPDLDVAVFEGEKFSYSLRRADFLALSADALERVNTVSFRFVSVRDRNDGLVNAYGTHVYRVKSGEDAGRVRMANVRYTLAFVDGDWYVSAVSLSGDSADSSDAGDSPPPPDAKTETP